MKNLLPILLVTLMTSPASAQSNSYEIFKDTFKGGKDVFSFGVRGWLARTVLRFADEDEFQEMISDVKTIKITVVPRQRFHEKDLSIREFKKILTDDSFAELAQVRDGGDNVTIYIQENLKRKHNNLYFILAEESDQVVAIEMRGDVSEESLARLKKEVVGNQYH
ncbi:MAG TPA: DUF4252 domain-containing protein [Cyclobacteriaceae bacterium]|jgi:hypothetical protein|nr:DUF4252 domain-containing protein [Cyclobacteriaceae bacterium]